MIKCLQNPPGKEMLVERAMDFSVEKSINKYLDVCYELIKKDKK